MRRELATWGLVATGALVGLDVHAQDARRCDTSCAFETRLRNDGCCTPRARSPSPARGRCDALRHLSEGHCCAMGESWDAVRGACACLMDGGCGVDRCSRAAAVAAVCEATSVAAGPSVTSARRPRSVVSARSEQLILNELRMSRGPLGPLLGSSPSAPALMRLAEDIAELLLAKGAQVDELDEALEMALRAHNDPQVSALQQQQEALRQEAAQYRDRMIATLRALVARWPEYEHADQALDQLAGALREAGHDDEAIATSRALVERFPRSRYAPVAHAMVGDLLDARGDAAAERSYEHAVETEGDAHEIGAYARYRLAWIAARHRDLAGAMRRLSKALDIARGAEDRQQTALVDAMLREAPLIVAAALVDGRAFDASGALASFQAMVGTERDAFEMFARMADHLRDRAAWANAIAAYRHLMVNASHDGRFCAWRAQAQRAMTCLRSPAPPAGHPNG